MTLNFTLIFNNKANNLNHPITFVAPETPPTAVEDRLKALNIDVGTRQETSSRIGDSGYTSLPGLPHTGLITPINTLELASRLADTESSEIGSQIEIYDNQKEIYDSKDVYSKISSAKNGFLYEQKSKAFSDVFEPKKVVNDKVNLYKSQFSVNLENVGKAEIRKSASVDDTGMSVVSSVWGDDRELPSTSGSENWEVPSTQLLEQLSNAGSKGSQRSEVQLR